MQRAVKKGFYCQKLLKCCGGYSSHSIVLVAAKIVFKTRPPDATSGRLDFGAEALILQEQGIV